MGDLRWYKRDPRAALTGMANLTLEECGAYNTLLDLIYCHDGAIDDDPGQICPWLKCNIRTWRRLRASLIDKEKIYLLGGKLRNRRADDEIAVALKRIQQQSLAGLESAKRRKFRETFAVDLSQNVTRLGNFNRLRPTDVQTPTTTKNNSFLSNSRAKDFR